MALERFRVAELTWPEYDGLIRDASLILPVEAEGFVPPTGSLTRSAGATAAVGRRPIDEASVRFAEILSNAWQ